MSVDLRLIKGGAATRNDETDKWRLDRAPGDVYVIASIDNYFQLQSAYGSAIALTVRHLVRERARQLCDSDAQLLGGGGARLLLLFRRAGKEPAGVDRAHRESILMEQIVLALGTHGVEFTWGTVFPVISARIVRSSELLMDNEEIGERSSLLVGNSKAWRAQYTSDMAIAADLLAALEDGDLRLDYEPIWYARGEEQVLYHEALLRKMTGTSSAAAGTFVPALERTGLVRRVDQWVMAAVVDTLRANPTVRLGCNVSALSAVVDIWWISILARLSEEPDVASRLTIEMTGTAPLDLAAASYFALTFQSLGCRIALDAVGAGYSNMEALVSLRPDVAKIDAMYIDRARFMATGQDCLAHLIGLASSCASRVVVEGIESDEDLLVAQRSGASWVQGYRAISLDSPVHHADRVEHASTKSSTADCR